MTLARARGRYRPPDGVDNRLRGPATLHTPEAVAAEVERLRLKRRRTIAARREIQALREAKENGP